MNEKDIITFIDGIGRTIIGELVSEAPNGVKTEEGSILVKNPAIIHVQPTQQGQLNVQTIPLYFRDFVSDKNKEEGTFWRYKTANIVEGVNVENDRRLIEQYCKLFEPIPAPKPVSEPAGDQKTIKLFDD